jgi:nucleotide-binding universal stress UspA family protein
MAIVFNKLLIPVDFSLNTGLAIKKATDLTGTDKAVLHLLHVVNPYRPIEALAAKTQLEELAQHTREDHPEADVKTHILKGVSTQRMIIECSKMLAPDLIVIGKQNHRLQWTFSHPRYWPLLHPRHWLPFQSISPSTLARKTNCPVLTAKPGSIDSRTKVILIPIRNFLPKRKLEWGVLLATRYRAQIHLLAIREKQHDGMPQVFLEAYHHLRESLHHPIEFSTVMQQNPARAALDYAELIMADLILVNPATESDITGFTGSRHISDLLERDSKIQVLDVDPYR